MDFNIENVSKTESKVNYVAEKHNSTADEKKTIDEVKDVAEITSNTQGASSTIPVIISKEELQQFLKMLLPSGSVMGLHKDLDNGAHVQKIGKLLKGS